MTNESITIKSIPGNPVPLGITRYGNDVNFAVSVCNVEKCRLILYSNDDTQTFTFDMDETFRTGNIFSIRLKNVNLSGYTYLYEAMGHVFTDPYARRITGNNTFGCNTDKSEAATEDTVRAAVDYSCHVWKDNSRPSYTYDELILYKLNVRGFTRHESSKVKHPGTYRGLTEKIKYMKNLGINALLLMPCMEYNEIISENAGKFGMPVLTDAERIKGTYAGHRQIIDSKVNLWGYTGEYAYFAPKASYASDPDNACNEFKEMVEKFHANSIEVLMEFNFTKGTNQSLILDTLRFWVTEYHIDGFRINAETTPAVLIATDPYLNRTKLIANNWNTDEIYGRDVTPEYKNLAECNEGFMSVCRRYLKGDEGQLEAFTGCIKNNPKKCGCINYITDHNGFTLSDLYMYDIKHNSDNGESGRDGTDYNYSWNCGAEGETKLKRVLELRRKMIKNALITLFISQGTPMLLAGDELCNSQSGNNNAYCQDNAVGWIEWNNNKAAKDTLEFTRQLIELRKQHRVFGNPIGLRMMDYISNGCPDISFHGTGAWYPDYSNYSRTIGILLNGVYAKTAHGDCDSSYYLMFNMHWEPHDFDLPSMVKSTGWSIVFTSDTSVKAEDGNVKTLTLPPRTAVICKSVE